MVADDDFPGAYLHLHRYRISVDLEHVCGCGGLCRAKGWHILYGADILFLKRNESAYVKDTLVKVAGIYGNSPEKVAQVTSDNTLKVFGMLK